METLFGEGEPTGADLVHRMRASIYAQDWPSVVAMAPGVYAQRVQLPPYLWLSQAYRKLDEFDRSMNAMEQAVRLFGPETRIEHELAELALSRGETGEAITRFQCIVSASRGIPPMSALLRLADSFVRLSDYSAAEKVLLRARSQSPTDGRVAFRLGRISAACSDWPRAVQELELAVSSEGTGAEAYISLARCHRHQNHVAECLRVIEKGRLEHPDSDQLARFAAEVHSDVGDEAAALGCWVDYLALRDDATNNCEPTLPKGRRERAPAGEAWIRLVRHLLAESPTGGDEVVHLDLEVGLLRKLVELREWDAVTPMLARLTSHDPIDDRVKTLRAIHTLESARPAPGEPVRRLRGTGSRRAARELADLESIVSSSNSEQRFDQSSSLPSLHLLSVARGSGLEVAVRSGWLLGLEEIWAQVRSLSSRDIWPEVEFGMRRLEGVARTVAKSFAKRFSGEIQLRADDLAESMYPAIYSELMLYEPTRRLAKDLASRLGSEMVYLELPTSQFSYFGPHEQRDFAVLYLYRHLRAAGVNVCLVEFVAGKDRRTKAILIEPSSSFLPCREPTSAPPGQPLSAVFPASIRSVDEVARRSESPIVYASGNRMSGTSSGLIDETGRLCPDRGLLGRFKVELQACLAAPGTEHSSAGILSRSGPVESDWLTWMRNAVLDCVGDLAGKCRAEVSRLNLNEVHVADHLTIEGALFSAAVRESGGTVSLWPHSSSPVDSRNRRAGSFHVVRSITKAGAEAWQTLDSQVDSVVDANLMLNRPSTRKFEVGLPISVVIVGGSHVLGLVPMIHLDQHEAAYQLLAGGLVELSHRLRLDVYVKPKARSTESADWFESLLPRALKWTPIEVSPRAIDLPNPIFVSMTVGSSALLEGLESGVPGIIVKEAMGEEYLLGVDEMFEVCDVEETLGLIGECAEQKWYETLSRNQVHRLCDATGLKPAGLASGSM